MFLCGYVLNSLRCVGSVAVTGESGFVPKPLLQSERDVDVVRIRCHRSLVSRWNKNPDVAALAPALGRGQVPIGYSFSSPSVLRWLDGRLLPPLPGSLPLPPRHRQHESGVRRERRRAARIEAERTELRETRDKLLEQRKPGALARVGVWRRADHWVCVFEVSVCVFWRWKTVTSGCQLLEGCCLWEETELNGLLLCLRTRYLTFADFFDL